MRVAVLKIKLYAPWVHSLKEKRAEVKSLTAKIRNRFNVSACESGEQDTHQTIVIGIAAVAGDAAQADSILDNVLNFAAGNTEAELEVLEREIF